MKTMQAILDDCGINVAHYERVSGGDINECYCLDAISNKYFLKINNASQFSGMFEKEANGLEALYNKSNLFVPAIVQHGKVGDKQYLLLEWIVTGRPLSNFWETFGRAMGQLHRQKQPYFGWLDDNYIGSLPQINTKHDSWNLFYVNCRIMPLVKKLFDSAVFNKNDLAAAELFYRQVEQVFPKEPPALLHGDLWSGNFMINQHGEAAIFDPAVYYGHREMDIGMTKLFGGFDERFYAAYNEAYPFEANWQQRLPLTQLYPLLVHAVLFGGHYIQSVRSILKTFL